MKNVFFFKSVCVVFFMFLVVWQASGQASKNTVSTVSEAVNIVIILDISDRIDSSSGAYTSKDQGQRDMKIIEYIADWYLNELVQKHLGQLVLDLERVPHELTIAIPKQPKAPLIPSNIMENLVIKDSKTGKKLKTLTEFKANKVSMLQSIQELYKWKDNPFTGADIWGWFNNYAKYPLKKDGFHNYIICLSDGYLKFNPGVEKGHEFMNIPKWRDEWKSNPKWKDKITPLSPIKEDFSDYNIKFMMVEIHPRVDKNTCAEHPADFDIIEACWEKWLNSIGITNSEFHRQIEIENLKEVIDSFFVLPSR